MPMPLRTLSSRACALVLTIALAAVTPAGCADSSDAGDLPAVAQMRPGPGGGRGMGPPPWAGRGMGMGMGSGMQRHRLAMMGGMTDTYRGLRSPVAATAATVSEGRRLYLAHCAACHGEQGDGNGPSAESLWPPPANLRWVVRRPMASDGYLMWAIAEGGTALGSAMPAFADALTESERWRIIAFLRTL